MFDDNFFSMLNSLGSNSSTTTETEQETNQTTSYGPQTSYSPYTAVQDEPYQDDYSTTQNYTEQQSYNTVGQNYDVEEQESESVQQYTVRQMDSPTIIKEKPAVNLTKNVQRIELHARMKIVIAMFSVIVATLLFAIVWNFASAAKMRATFAGKEQEIAQLQESILGLKSEYTSLDNDELIKLKAENEGYVDQNVDNTIDVEVKKIYEETAVEDLPSNWFNDVCDFLSGIFS